MARLEELIVSVPEPAMRMRLMNRFVNQASPEVVVEAVERAARSTDRMASRVLMTSLVHLLMESRPRPNLEAGPFMQEPRKEWPSAARIAQVIGAATRTGAAFTATMLRALWELPDRSDARNLPPHISIEHLALGVRRERARSPRRELLLPLLVETHPSVVTLLAGNPRLREADAVRLCALRPQHPYALWAMLLRPRWLSSPPVLEAIALNPACQPWMWISIAPLLSAKTAAHALRSRGLPTSMVEAARELHRGRLVAVIDDALRRRPATQAPPVIRVGADAETVVDEGGLADAVAVAATLTEQRRLGVAAQRPSEVEWAALPVRHPPRPISEALAALPVRPPPPPPPEPPSSGD